LHDCLGWARGVNCGECYVCHLRLVAAECRRVLRPDGLFWLNLGGYAAKRKRNAGLKSKDMAGVPWRVALALQADGWYLRRDIIWSKENPMPENAPDRPSTNHEYVFMLSKRSRYYFDMEAVKEPVAQETLSKALHYGGRKRADARLEPGDPNYRKGGQWGRKEDEPMDRRHLRSVWTMPTQGYAGQHFAVMPERLAEIPILASTSAAGCCPTCGAQWVRVVKKEIARPRSDNPNAVIPYTANGSTTHGVGKTSLHMVRSTHTAGWKPTCACGNEDAIPSLVLDPFAGSGTTGLVARRLGRRSIMLDLSLPYLRDEAFSRLGLKALRDWEEGRGVKAEEAEYEPGSLFWRSQ